MGKRLITQRRGKGSLTYKYPGHRFNYPISYQKTNEKALGFVKEIIKEPSNSAPKALIKFDNNLTSIPASLNLRENDLVSYNNKDQDAKLKILKLKDIPEGTQIYNIENTPGDGGKFCRAGGGSANLVFKTKDYISIQLPSRKERKFNPDCRATI